MWYKFEPTEDEEQLEQDRIEQEDWEKNRKLCPYCNGTTLNLAHPEDEGTCPHCFDGYIPA